MAEPLMPQTVAEQLQEMNTHRVRFINKVAPYNSGEKAWFPAAVAARYCIQGVAEPLECKDGRTGETLGLWNLAPHQMVVATQIQAARENEAGDYAQLSKVAAVQAEEEAVKVNQSDVNAEEADEAGAFSQAAKGDEDTETPTAAPTLPPSEIAAEVANDPVEQPAPKKTKGKK